MNTLQISLRYRNEDHSRQLFSFLSMGCFLGLSLAMAGSALAQDARPIFNTMITSLDFSGSGMLPLGPSGAFISTQVNGTKATDYNSSRSNRTTSIAGPPNDLDIDEEDGRTFDLFSTIDVEFDLAFTTTDALGFAGALGDTPIAETVSNVLLELKPGVTFDFDKNAPDFGMLRASGPPKKQSRGHVTVLKIAFNGGGGDIDLAAEGMALSLDPGTDKFTTLANGNVSHSVAFTLDLTGMYAGQAFVLTGLTGTLIEEGQLANTIVPEPSTAVLVIAGFLLGPTVRRKRS